MYSMNYQECYFILSTLYQNNVNLYFLVISNYRCFFYTFVFNMCNSVDLKKSIVWKKVLCQSLNKSSKDALILNLCLWITYHVTT